MAQRGSPLFVCSAYLGTRIPVSGFKWIPLFTYLGDEAFTATLEDAQSGETIEVSSAQVNAQAFPILWVLGLLARVGIKAAIKQIGKSKIKKATSKYLLQKANANTWKHIRAKKHNWGKIGGTSRSKIANLMSRAMANGKHSKRGANGMQAVLPYKGKYIVVTYAKKGGKISNGWWGKP